jgi:hypothetical protein
VSDQQRVTVPRTWGFRRLAVIAALLIGSVIAASLALQTTRLFERPQFGLGALGTLHSALLTNGQVYYGTLQQVGPNYIVLSKVYYVQTTADDKTGARTNKLIDRAATDWHAPLSMTIPIDKIVFIEVVGPDSTVAKLIAASKAKS